MSEPTIGHAHSIGITKGAPILSRDVYPDGRSKSRPTWHGTCSCGWTGQDYSDAVSAQDEALSHQADRIVRRSVIQRVTETDAHNQPTGRRPWSKVR